MLRKEIAAILALIPSALCAQTTWIVDASGGPGTHFNDLPPAVAAAKDGDRIVVRKGRYAPATTSKALHLLGAPGATIVIPHNGGFAVSGLGRGKTFVMRGFVWEAGWTFSTTQAPLTLEGNDGVIALHENAFHCIGRHYAVSVKDCRAVTLNTCALQPGLTAESSSIAATGCLFRAFDTPQGPAANGIAAYKTLLELTQSSASGSTGGGHAGSAPAVRAYESTVVVRGDAQSAYEGGLYAQTPSPSFQGGGGARLILDPRVGLRGAITDFIQVTRRRSPLALATGGAIGGAVRTTLDSPQGQMFLAFASLPVAPVSFPPLGGDSWLDLRTLLFVGTGLQGASERHTLVVPVPNMPALAGTPIVFQYLSGGGLPPSFEHSNPAVVILQ